MLVDGRELHVVVVHFGLIHASRERQVQRLGRYVANEVPADAPLIVAGDFNDWGAQLLKPMGALDLRTFDGIRLPTYPARLPMLHLHERSALMAAGHLHPGLSALEALPLRFIWHVSLTLGIVLGVALVAMRWATLKNQMLQFSGQVHLHGN